MRSYLAGLIVLGLAAVSAWGQVTGFVESIGYNNVFRPDCWTPMMVDLRSQVSEPMNYQLQVWQEDLDRDRVVYTKDITLSPSAADKFQLYFLPQPTDGSLPSNDPAKLQRAVQVRVCLPPKTGQKPEEARVIIDRLPVQFSIDNADPAHEYASGRNVGKKLVLWVGDGISKPQLDGYANALGMTEGVIWVQVPLTELGENVLYFNAADAILWMGANAEDLDKGGAKRLEALDEYVREGGHLVVCQPAERSRIAAFAGLLPIELRDAADNWLVELRTRDKLDHDQDALPRLAEHKLAGQSNDKWEAIKGPISIGVPGQIKPDAVIERAFLEKWDGEKTSPYIVRRAYGLGAVTWVAQDLGNPNLRAAESTRWPYVWDRVFGWNNDTHVQADTDGPTSNSSFGGNMPRIPFPRTKSQNNPNQMTVADEYGSSNDSPIDLGQSLLRGMDFQAKGAAYIFVAILFFIGYWIVAGPGTYLVLSNKKKRELNWFAFGFWAFVATALTLGVVRLLLRGSAEVRHQTIVRVVQGQPAYVHSRIGLYIPRDGYQAVELKDNSKDAASFVTPFNIHPAYLTPTDYPAAQDYAIPVHDDPQPVRLEIPYRSTLKKLQARWIGGSEVSIAGDAKLMPGDSKEDNYITGRLGNQTGVDLKNVYMVFHHIARGDATGAGADYIFYLPHWNKGGVLDLQAEYNLATSLARNNGEISADKGARGALGLWAARWYKSYSSGNMFTQNDTRGDDFGAPDRRGWILMSLIDRLPPDKRDANRDRVDLLRRGGHDLDVSQSIAAGQLVILAEGVQSDRPLPFPLVVDGDKVAGEGTILYQFVLPLDQTEMLKALSP